MHPQQKDCDTNDPKKFAAWAFAAGLPDVGVRAGNYIPNLISPQLVEGVSEMLWHFGFRHIPSKQTKWIDGVGALGSVGQIVDKEPDVDPVTVLAEQFLAEEDPRLLEAIKKAPPEKKQELLKELEKNFKILQGLIETVKDT